MLQGAEDPGRLRLSDYTSCTLTIRPKWYPLGQVAMAHHQLGAKCLEHHNKRPELGCETLGPEWVTHLQDRMSCPSAEGWRSGSVLGPLSFTGTAGSNSIRKSQGDHAEAVNTDSTGHCCLSHKGGESSKEKKCSGDTSAFPTMTSTVVLILFALCCN